ncbi:MAG: DUF1801 domain-containing protein [Anaplasmataceae bacterium]|nr:DUF1801 domain-containing protein [Anaplasmataceae bacterium]
MNMFKPVKVKSVEEYFKALTPERRKILEKVDGLVRKAAPKLKRHFAYNMIGYGSFPYLNYKKEKISWPIVAMASQKNYISVYVCAVDGKEYVAEKYKDKLGKVSVGKSCIRFKNLDDVNLDTLKKVIQIAAKKPGLVKS